MLYTYGPMAIRISARRLGPASGKEFKSEASWDTAWEAAGYMDMLSSLLWLCPYNIWYISDIYIYAICLIYIYIYMIMFIIMILISIIITTIYYDLSLLLLLLLCMYVWYMLMVSTVTGCNWAIFSPLGQASQRHPSQTGPLPLSTPATCPPPEVS